MSSPQRTTNFSPRQVATKEMLVRPPFSGSSVDRAPPAGQPRDLVQRSVMLPFASRRAFRAADSDHFTRRPGALPCPPQGGTDARRTRVQHHHRPRRLSPRAERRRRRQDVRQSRHDRAADHARALLGAGDGLCAGPAGGDRDRHGRRLRPRLGQAGVVQRPRGARPRQRHRLDLHLASCRARR